MPTGCSRSTHAFSPGLGTSEASRNDTMCRSPGWVRENTNSPTFTTSPLIVSKARVPSAPTRSNLSLDNRDSRKALYVELKPPVLRDDNRRGPLGQEKISHADQKHGGQVCLCIFELCIAKTLKDLALPATSQIRHVRNDERVLGGLGDQLPGPCRSPRWLVRGLGHRSSWPT